VFVFPGASIEAARGACERLCSAIRAHTWGSVLPEGRKVTASFGVAEAGASPTTAEWLARADRALYRAKSLGRDRVCVDDGATVRPA